LTGIPLRCIKNSEAYTGDISSFNPIEVTVSSLKSVRVDPVNDAMSPGVEYLPFVLLSFNHLDNDEDRDNFDLPDRDDISSDAIFISQPDPARIGK
jgi:hypothetical protein